MADDQTDSQTPPTTEADQAAETNPAQAQMLAAAKSVNFVVLPLACTNEGKGAPLAMGLQRWFAQELTQDGSQAAAPVFTAMSERDGEKVPALMVYRDAWNHERIKEGIERFPNAKRALVADFHVEDNNLKLTPRLVDLEGESYTDIQSWDLEMDATTLPEKIFEFIQEVTAKNGAPVEAKNWKESAGTEDPQAMLAYLLGLGNLSALQGRCFPTTSDQLLTPLMDCINRDPQMDSAMDAIHQMVDILIAAQPDKAAVPLSVQALSIAAQKREKDATAQHHLALVLRKLGDMPQALQAFNKAFNIDPTNEAIAATFIESLRAVGDSENASKVAEFAIEKGNEGAPVMAMYGSILIEGDKFDEAESFLRRAIDEGKIPNAYGDLANVLWDRADGDTDAGKEDRNEAIGLLRSALELNLVAKNTLDMLLDLHEEESVEEATKLLIEAGERHGGNPTVLTAVSNMYLDGDDPAKARPYLEKILTLDNRSLDDDAFARRNRLALDIEKFDERYDQAVEHVHSENAEQRTQAASFMREIIAKDQRFWQPHLMLALAVRSTEGDTAALGHLNNAVQLRPNDAEIRNLLAAILRKQGQPAEAVEHLRVVVALNPRSIDPVRQLAKCLRDANMFDEARAVCDTALKMVPDDPAFKEVMASLPPPKAEQN